MTKLSEQEPTALSDEELHSETLNNICNDELILMALLLPIQTPTSTANYKKGLIEQCLKGLRETEKANRGKKLFTTLDEIRKYEPRMDEYQWIPDPMSKRLEEFLYRNTGIQRIKINGVSNSKQFLLLYRYSVTTNTLAVELIYVEKSWPKHNIPNELSFLKNTDKKDLTDFLEYFIDSYKKMGVNINPSLTHKKLSYELKTEEDALIYLDILTDNAEARSNILKNARVNWKQNNSRKKSTKKQKNFSLEKKTVNALNNISKKHGITETEILSILIHGEHKKEIYLRAYYDEVQAKRQVMKEIMEST